MGTITINVDDETEKRFREAVIDEYGKGKGTLGKAVDEALNKWTKEKRISVIREKALKLLKKGFDLKGVGRLSRKELYDEMLKHRIKH